VTGLSQAADHARRLVRRDAARDPDEYLRHVVSIQSTELEARGTRDEPLEYLRAGYEDLGVRDRSH
jgi:hypothetical protein